VISLRRALIAAFLALGAATSAPAGESPYPELPNFHQVDPQLFRGAQPAAGGIARLKSLGVRTIVNLRHEPERVQAERQEAVEAGLRYFSVPMHGLSGPTHEQVREVLKLLDEPDNWPVFVHCKAGADRTGVIVACQRIARAGWTAEQAIREAMGHGMMKIAFAMRRTIRAFHATWQEADQAPAATVDPLTRLWVNPTDLPSRDLFHGPGGRRLVPRTDVVYRFKELDTTGHSGGYDVEDPQGRTWDVKIGDEAQSETVVSRILWAIGYHQPVTYYVPKWRMTGGPTGSPEPGRFRLESDHRKEGEWSWTENPFVDARPYRGLVVANLLLNNWDLAASNNRIYTIRDSREGPATRFVVQDVGGSLGKSRWPLGSRNVVEDFESQDFIRRLESGRVKFAHYRHGDLLRTITPEDVVWTCRLMARLTDRQLQDAFRAAGYPRDVRDRYVRKIRQKIQQGLALATRSADTG
jgi:protein tyrosine/serine phosphatase